MRPSTKTQLERVVERSKGIVQTLLKEYAASPEENRKAMSRIMATPALFPVAQLIDVSLAALVEPLLQGIIRLSVDSRVAVSRLISWHLQDESWGKSRMTMIAELNMPESRVKNIETVWPDLYVVINLLVRQKLYASRHKVDHSTLLAAVVGDSRDRRLYYELIGELKKDMASPNEKGITFVNNVFVRPQASEPVVVDVVVDKEG